MADPLWGTQLTDMWMANPWMFDPTQKSNQFSNYNNAPLPWPPSYSGVPTDAMGRPIQSFVDWQKANPGGMSINATPAQPQAPQQGGVPTNYPGNMSQGAWNAANAASNPDPTNQAFVNAWLGAGGNNWREINSNPFLNNQARGGPAPQTTGAPQAGGAPNNWTAALNALANPGNPVTQGANVPLAQGYQPAGGVNQAFLQQAGAGQGMNQGFLSALRAIQGR